jgi:hypothetical protein
MTEKRYGIVVISYNPPDLLLNLIKILIIFNQIYVFIVDSSPTGIQLELEEKINKIKSEYSQHRVAMIKTKNLGAGYSLNLGIKKCIEEGMNLITILDDDTILDKENFNPEVIWNFFFTNINPKKDVLILAQGIPSKMFYVETGLTFTKEVFCAIQFREDFIMDQIDLLFCLKVRERGGHLVMYPLSVLDNLPVGREVNGNIATLPIYRMYTLARNSLTMAFQSRHKMILFVFAIYQISYWSLRSLRGKQNLFQLVSAICWGILDFLRRNYGVTDKLEYLSSGRFKKN